MHIFHKWGKWELNGSGKLQLRYCETCGKLGKRQTGLEYKRSGSL